MNYYLHCYYCNFVPFLGYIGMVKAYYYIYVWDESREKGPLRQNFWKIGFAGLLKSNKKIIINSKHVKCKWPVFCTVDGLPYIYKLCEQVLVIQYREGGREGGRERHDAYNTQYFLFQRIKVMILPVKIRMKKIKAHMKDLNDG